ncbi:MAG: hypothetical protein ABR915_01175 [Thermoguttaceae bacterium]
MKASVSDSGAITLGVRVEESGGAYKVSELLRAETETLLGEGEVLGRGVGKFTNVFHTTEPSSVQFLVKQGDSVFVPTGAEKDLLQFAPRGEKKGVAARYTIRVRRAAMESEKIVTDKGVVIEGRRPKTDKTENGRPVPTAPRKVWNSRKI